MYHDVLLSLSSESDSSLEEDTELSELVRSGSSLYGEGGTTSANSSSTSSAMNQGKWGHCHFLYHYSLQIEQSTAGLDLTVSPAEPDSRPARLPQCMSASHTLNTAYTVFVWCNFYEPYLQENYNLGCTILNMMSLHPELPKCKKTI